MTLKDDLKAYQARWMDVEEIINKEHRSASLELRWRQLNSAHALAKGLGLLQRDQSEAGVFALWVKLKEGTTNLIPKT